MTKLYTFLFIALIFASCKKEPEEVVFSNNEIASYDQVPRILIENYVNRVFIDLIGREPTDLEMEAESNALKSANADVNSRNMLVQKLMFNEDFVEGDGSYRDAFIRKFYEDQKGRFIDGASDANLLEDYNVFRSIAIQDSLEGNFLVYEIVMIEANKVLDVLNSREQLKNGEIDFREMCRRMMFNSIYDDINMNTFNFINATFDDCFARFPTESEYNGVEDAIEFNGSGALFGQTVNSKPSYLNVIVNSNEFDEGYVRWVYGSFLAREATSNEVFVNAPLFSTEADYTLIQQKILISNEYAGFE